MPSSKPFGELDKPIPTPTPPKADTPFRIAVLGDFTGRGSRLKPEDAKKLLARKSFILNRDDFEDTLAGMGIELKLALAKEKVDLAFASLDDFHPDQLYEKISSFEDLDDDEEKTGQMRDVLHHAAFRALESNWRGLDWLLRRAQTSDQVQVVLYDITLDELAADLNAQDDLTKSAMYQLLIEKATQGPKGQPWATLVGLYAFDVTAAHADLLGRIAKIAAQASAPFVSGIHARVAEKAPAIDKAAVKPWETLRQLPEAGYVGLALPGFLLRLPYGENTKTIDRFGFEESPTADGTRQYLWGNAGLACAALLAMAFTKQGWAFKPGSVMDLTDMPMHVYVDEDDEKQMTLGETWIATTQSQGLVKQGYMPFLPVKGKDAVQLAKLQSITGTKELAGRWTKAEAGTAKPPPRAGSAPVKVSVGFSAKEPPPPPKETVPAESTEAASTESSSDSFGDTSSSFGDSSSFGSDTSSTDTFGTDTPPSDASADPAMDPEMAELMRQLEQGGS
jgi:type VI secretion system protein ImpC